MIDFLKGTVGKDYFSDRLYGCQECIAEYLASKKPCVLRRLVTLPNKIKLISIILRDVSITKVIAPALALVW